jgi:hypothetical protein
MIKEWTMSAKRFMAIVCVLLLLFPGSATFAQAQEGDLGAAVDWIKDQQQADGGFSNGVAPESDVSTTADVILGIAFAGENPTLIKSGDKTPIDFLEGRVRAGEVEGAGVIAKVILALNAIDLDPRAFAEEDLVALLLEDYDDETYLFGLGPFDSALAISALQAIDEPLPDGVLEGLLATRLDDGSYSYISDPNQVTGDSNSTALVVQALLAAGAKDEIEPSIAYFKAVQNEDGGWTFQKPSEFGEDTDVNSTALVIQAIKAAGEDLEEWGDPMATLTSFQLKSGAFIFNLYFPDENILATVQAIPTLAGRDYVDPVAPTMLSGIPSSTVVIVVVILLVVVLAAAYVVARNRSRSVEAGRSLGD